MKNSLRLLLAALMLAGTFAAATAPIKNTQTYNVPTNPMPDCVPGVDCAN